MKPIRKILALLCLAGLSLFANAQGGLQQQPGFPYQISGTYIFTSASGPSGGFNVQGLRYWQISFVTIGTVSSCSVSLDSSTGGGFTIGGIISAGTIGSCASPGVYTNSTATTPTLVGQLTPTITGSGSVIVVILGYVNNPGVSGSSAASITSPVDGSGYVEVNCKTGCGSTTLGQTVMASSLPVAIASNQSAVPVSGTFWQTTQPVSLATAPTTPVTGTFWQTTQPVSLATAPTTPTQPSGFSSSPLTAQVSVTATAAALASNSTHTVCVEAVIANTIPVYVGASGVTTSTGFALNPGDEFCWQVNNSNLLYLIASTTGASIQWTAL